MDDRFAESLFHKQHAVCGVRLHPFTFAHAAALDFAGSPYSGCAGNATMDDIVLALAILSRPGRFPITLPRRGFLWTLFVSRAVKRVGLLEAHAALLTYFNDYNSPPEMWDVQGSKAVKCPWMLYFVAMLVRYGRMSQAEAWACEVGHGRWLAAALSEAAGNEVPFITDAERKAMKEAGWNG